MVVGLIVSAGATLLDIVPDRTLASEIRTKLEVGGVRLSGLHLGGSGLGTPA